ncbi:MAG: peptide ABC transporter substrate-binding protein [Candidatus Eremiobacteraeota bacterium]|nr:peptide ABC transporter substrate-binding protein [Candidatus Eremiobacteraeota bacterium]MBV8356231.1 peptide ABC transporter substrate-binding protein [Candidatus Eremiobacteraeota bacterium]
MIYRIALALTIVLSLAGSAAAQNAAREPHVLTYADGQAFKSLNPHLDSAVSLGFLSQLTMAYLVRYDARNRPIPELVTAVPTEENHGISKDGKTITWHLRRGVKWSDGAPFDADDVVFSTNAVLNPKNNEIGRDGWDLITKIDEPDKYTVVFHLKKPYAAYLPTFFGSAGANPCVLPKHILGDLPDINEAPYNALPVGIGPFRYTRWSRADRVEMEANPNYWRGLPKLKRIIYKQIPDSNTLLTQLTTGEIDLWPLAGTSFYDRLKALKDRTTIVQPSFLYAHIDFNVSRPILADVRVRQALRFALDRDTIIQKVFHDIPTAQESPISPVSPAYHAFPRVPHDTAKANALLDAAGWKQRGPDGIRMKSGRKLSLEYAIYTGVPAADTMIELIREMWKQIGVDIQVRHYETSLFFATVPEGGIVYGGKFDVTSFAWLSDVIGDISAQYSCPFIPPNGQDIPRWCDKRFDDDLKRFKLLYSFEKRQPLINDAVARLIDQVPVIVVYSGKNIYSYKPELTGFHPNGQTPFDDFMNVDI